VTDRGRRGLAAVAVVAVTVPLIMAAAAPVPAQAPRGPATAPAAPPAAGPITIPLPITIPIVTIPVTVVTIPPTTPPPPTIVVTPTCAPSATGGTISLTVTGANWSARYGVRLQLVGRPDTMDGQVNADGTFTLTFVVGDVPDGTWTVAATPLFLAARAVAAQAQFTVPCPASPTLDFRPPLGPPGFTTTLVGKGWPPNAGVTIQLDRRMTSRTGSPVTADAAGAFTVAVLVLPRSDTGDASTTATAVEAKAAAHYLVVAGSVQPSGQVATLTARR